MIKTFCFINYDIQEDLTSMTENQTQPAHETEQAASAPNQSSGGRQFHLDSILQKRLIATFIDMVLVGVVVIILTLPAMVILPSSPINFAALFGFFVCAAGAAIILVKDMPFQFAGLDSQTPGKKAMNIRVTDMKGDPITMQMSINRNIIPALPMVIGALSNLLNIVTIPIISGLATFFIITPLLLVAFVANIFEMYKIFSGQQHRRWGDTFAGTIVAWE